MTGSHAGDPSSSGGPSCAVRMSNDAHKNAALDAHLAGIGVAEAARFRPKDDDDLNQALCAGRYKRVVFLDIDALFEAVWKDLADLDRWEQAGVRIELVSAPVGDGESWRKTVAAVHAGLIRWRRADRRRQIVVAVILSALALAAVGALLWLVPPPP